MKQIRNSLLKLLILASLFVLFIGVIPSVYAADIVASGYCGGEGDGTNLTWTLDSEGVLTISGTGKMKDYSTKNNQGAPWRPRRLDSVFSSMKEIRILDGVESVGNYAFYDLHYAFGLKSIYMADSVTEIGNYAFSEILEQITVTLSENLQVIGDHAFYLCYMTGTLDLPESVVNVGSGAFFKCIYLDKVIIHENTRIFGGSTFGGCKKLTTAGPIGSNCSIEYAWADKIPDQAFSGCDSLLTVQIADSIREIGAYALNHCGIEEIDIPNSVQTIGNYAFARSKLKEIEIPESIKTIGDNAFEYCQNIESITIPSNATTGKHLFSGCKMLKTAGPIGGNYNLKFGWDKTIPREVFAYGDFTDIYIPDSIEQIEALAFERCSSLSHIVIAGEKTRISGAIFPKCPNLISAGPIGGNYNIEYASEEQAKTMFAGANALTTVVLPDSMEKLPSGMFGGCSSLINVDLPVNLKEIDTLVFSKCKSLKKIVIPAGTTRIWLNAFPQCDQLTEVYFEGNAPQVYELNGKYEPSFPSAPTLYYKKGCTGWTDSSAYDAAAGTWNGYPLKVWKTGFEETTPAEDEKPTIENEPQYYPVTENRLFRIYASGSDYPAPAGFDVQVGEDHFNSGLAQCTFTDDVTVRVPSGYTGTVTISKSGYHTCTLPETLTGSYNTVLMMPQSVTAPFAQALLSDHSSKGYRAYRNLLFGDTETVYELSIDHEAAEQTLYPIINWNGHGTGSVWLEQNGKKLNLTSDAANPVRLAEHFTTGGQIYLCLKAGDGTEQRTKVNIDIIQRVEVSIKADLGDSFDIPTESEQEELKIAGGHSLKIDFKDLLDGIPISVEIKEDGTVKGTIGIKLMKGSSTEGAFGGLKEAFSQIMRSDETEKNEKFAKMLKNVEDQYGYIPERHSTFGVSGNVQVVGYFTGNVLDGKLRLLEMEFAFVIKGGVTYKHQTIVAGIPAYLKVALKNKLSQSIKLTYDENWDFLKPAGKQPLQLSFAVNAECGPGWEGYISCGVQGGVTLKVYTSSPVKKEETFATIQGELSIVGTLMGQDGTWKLGESREMVFYEDGTSAWHEKGNATQTGLQFVPDNTIQVMQYAAKTAPNGTIVEKINGYNTPCLAELPDGGLLAVWAADVPARAVTDSTGLYYSVCRNGTWSAPVLVADDGTTDFAPSLQTFDGEIWLVWQNYTKVFGGTSLDALSSDEIAANCDIAAARFDTASGVFGAAQNISCAGYDYAPQLSTQDGAVAAAWKNGSQTYQSTLVNDIWSEAAAADVSWYQVEQPLPSSWTVENAPTTCSTRQILCTTEYQAIVYSAADEAGNNQVFALINDGYGWGEPLQLTEVSSSSIGGFSAVITDDYQIKILAAVWSFGENGAYEYADLMLLDRDLNCDLAVSDADYIRDTLVAGQAMTFTVDVTNNSGKTVQGVRVTAKNGTTELASSEFGITLLPGQTKTAYLNYTLPGTLSLTSAEITVLPTALEDLDAGDNTAECLFRSVDISIEACAAVRTDSGIQILAQVVNRGSSASESFEVVFHQSGSEGVELGRQGVEPLAPGELKNVILTLDKALAEGEMVCVTAEPQENENLLGNNSAYATVRSIFTQTIDMTAAGVYEDGKLTVRVSVNNQTKAAKDLRIMVAAYAEDGRMIGVSVSEQLRTESMQTYDHTLLVKTSAAPASWKVFILDAATASPICAAWNVTVE